MGDALTSCARLISAGSGDDVRRLIERLERDLQQLKSQRAPSSATSPTTSARSSVSVARAATCRCDRPASSPTPARRSPREHRRQVSMVARRDASQWRRPRPPMRAPQQPSFSAGVPMVMRTPTPGNGRSTTPARSLYSPSTAACSPQRQPHEVRLRLDDVESELGDAVGDTRRVPRSLRRRAHASRRARRATRPPPTCASRVRRERHAHLAQRADHVDARDRVADAQRGEAVRLREGAQHRDVVVVGAAARGRRGSRAR